MRELLTFLIIFGFSGLNTLKSQAYFVENKGQWQGNFSAKLELKQGAVFFTGTGYKVVLVKEGHQHQHSGHQHVQQQQALAYEVEVIGAIKDNTWSGKGESSYPRNYILGNNPVNWKQNLGSYPAAEIQSILPGANFEFYEQAQYLKYDIKLEKGFDLASLKMVYKGLESVKIEEGALHLETAFGTIIERIPYSYQIIDGQEVPININYKLVGDTLSFSARKIRSQYPLVIDPVLEFATFSGSGDLNFGNSATYGENGTMYGAGVNFGVNYPTTLGVFQPAFAGDSIFNVDVTISKFSADGKQLLYATYLGGRDIDVVHSLISDAVGNLIVLGNTGSNDFPTTTDAFQAAFAGGDFQSSFAFNNYNSGSDLFISKISADGSTLLNSTFWGGSKNDGFNKEIYKNYGDHYRSEVILTDDGSILVVSSTLSMDVPLVGLNSLDRAQNSQDALVGLFSDDLKTLYWGRYFGGINSETGYAAKAFGNKVYITGATKSNDLPTSIAAHADIRIGEEDGYVAAFNLSTGNLEYSTYFGTTAEDQSFMLDIDYNGAVYIAGQTKGVISPSPGVFSSAGSRQFIAQLDSTLTTVVWQTMIGSGQNKQDLVPSAFMVDECLNIYFSGWNGVSNTIGFPGVQNGDTYGLPVTGDAFQNSTDGSDFYFMVLDHNANKLLYASYLGGTDNEHVDGGTSRFSKDGTIYQAVCSNCNNKSFPTTPGAYAPNSGSPGCNMAVFKFSFDQILAADAQIGFTTAVDSICDGLIVNLQNNSNNATNYKWIFGNGETSTQANPTVIYQDLGNYTIQLIAYDTICQITDTAYIEIAHSLARKPITNFIINYVGCDMNLEADFENLSIIADTYLWNFGDGNISTLANPKHKFPGFGSYQIELIAFDTVCMRSDTTYKYISFVDSSIAPEISADVSLCSNGEVDIVVSNHRESLVYEWTIEGVTYKGPNPAIRFETPGNKQIELLVTDTICSKIFEQSFNVFLDEIRNEVYAASAFTPDGDGLNDRFQIFGDPCKSGANLQIFNRWGIKVFESNEPYTQFWEGTFQGQDSPSGVYTYVLLERNQKVTGFFSLIR